MANWTQRRFAALVVCLLACLALFVVSGCGDDDDDGSGDSASATDTPSGSTSSGPLSGKTIKVALIAYYPFCDYKGDEATGLEPEMLELMSEKLGFEIEYSLVDFAGQLAGVQAGRYDLGMCDFYWTTDRVPRGVFTDPIAYTPVQVVQREGGEVNTVKGFEGKNLGSITGYSWNPALKAVPGANVRLFPEPPALLADVAAGRIDVAPADPLVTQAAIDERPEWKLEVQDLTPPTAEELAAHPEYKLLRPSQIAWYAAKGQDELANALTEQIREMYADGTLAELLEKYGGSASWLVPPGDYIADERRGLDRPDDWEPPSTE